MKYGPYSYSRVKTYDQCQLKFKLAYIDNVKVESIPSPAMERGSEIHKSIEDYIRGTVEFLHPDIHSTYGPFFLGLRENYDCYTEEPFGLTWEFEFCDYDSPEVAIRGYRDLKIRPREGEDGETIVYEHKTGKIYPDHVEQRALYGLVTLVQHPELESVKVTNIYVDQVQVVSTDYHRSMLSAMIDIEKRRIDKIESTVEFIPNPTYLCRFCKFSRHNGGPCQF